MTGKRAQNNILEKILIRDQREFNKVAYHPCKTKTVKLQQNSLTACGHHTK